MHAGNPWGTRGRIDEALRQAPLLSEVCHDPDDFAKANCSTVHADTPQARRGPTAGPLTLSVHHDLNLAEVDRTHAGGPRGTQGKLDAALRQVLGRGRGSVNPADYTLVFIDPADGPPGSLEEICAVHLRQKLVEQAAQLLELKRQVGLHASVAVRCLWCVRCMPSWQASLSSSSCRACGVCDACTTGRAPWAAKAAAAGAHVPEGG